MSYQQIQQLNQVVLPKSPYLKKMHCAFREIARINNSRNETQALKSHQAQEKI